MYKLTLILKYLRRKLGPMFAAMAVMLCTAMVIIVISVMGGFLDQLQTSAKQLTGDVNLLSMSLTGFAHYEDLAARLEALDEVEAASPIISTFGMINMRGDTIGVTIRGIDPEGFARIVPYEETLHWSAKDLFELYNLDPDKLEDPPPSYRLREMAMTLKPAVGDLPAVVSGIEVNRWHRRDDQGRYNYMNSVALHEVTLTVLPLTERGAPAEVGPVYRKGVVVNEFKTGLYEVDNSQVFVHISELQQMLEMDRKESKVFDQETGEELPGVSVRPARASAVLVRGAEGFRLGEVARAVQGEVDRFAADYPDSRPPRVLTWEQMHTSIIKAVKNEKGMITFLFVIISIVAVFMVGTTFYMTVLEKTRDIGVLRAVGASQPGIIGMYLGYGLVVGTVGALSGLLLAVVIVVKLNEVQFWLANYLGVTSHFAWSAVGLGLIGAIVGGVIGFKRRRFVKLASICGLALGVVGLTAAWGVLLMYPELGPQLNQLIRFEMWNPEIYYFDRIPARIDYTEAIAIVIGAILASVIGALLPAVIAAELDPVETLRHE